MTIAGLMPTVGGLHLAVTHSGVTLTPALGPLLAESIATSRVPEALVPFGLERFQTFAY